MNPLCCIAPVSVNKDRPVLKTQTLNQELVLDGECCYEKVRGNEDQRPVNFGDKCGGEIDEATPVAGILYKWVNFVKGWGERWFVLEDGVLSYYEVHGPDKNHHQFSEREGNEGDRRRELEVYKKRKQRRAKRKLERA